MSSAFVEASSLAHCVEIRKFSATTYPADVKSPEMPAEMRRKLDRHTIGHVWRARIGRQRRWWYGWTAEEALLKALRGGGHDSMKRRVKGVLA